MTGWFSDKYTTNRARAPGPGAAGKKAKTEIYIPKLAGMQKRLAKLFQSKEILTGGRLQMIGLQEVREQIGGNWHRVEAAVHALTEEILQESMGDEDIYLRYGTDKYLIIFASKTHEAAEVTAAAIARKIRDRLFDEEDTLKDRVMVETTIVSLDTGKITDGDNPFADLDYAVDRKRAAKRKQSTDPLEEDFDQSSYQRGQSMHMVYMPLWDARRAAMSAYLAVLTDSVVQDENTLTNFRQICQERTAGEVALLDIRLIQEAVDEARSMVRDGRKFLMVCPVHVDTLSMGSTRSQFKELCKEFPESMRKFLLFNLLGVHEGIDKAALRNHVKLLCGIGRTVWSMSRMNDFRPRLYEDAGIKAVGFYLPRNADERRLMAWMDKVSDQIKVSGLGAFLLDVPSLSIATSAVCAGFAMIGGPVVHEYVDHPSNATRFRHEDLFAGISGTQDDAL